MDKGSWKHSLLLAVVLASTYADASLSWHMDDFIQAVKQVEDGVPGSGPVAVLKRLRHAAGLNDALVRYFLRAADSGGAEMDVSLLSFITKAVHHRVTEENREEGVVLTPDGTTVALTPLLLGLEAGFLSKTKDRVRGLLKLTFTKDLESHPLSRHPLSRHLGPDGCWDNVSSPQVFTLLDQPGVLTTAQINGGMDGFVLGTEIAFPSTSGRPLKLSGILTEYYCRSLEVGGMDVAPRLISRRRRDNFRKLGVPSITAQQVVKSAEKQRRVMGLKKMDSKTKKQLMTLVKEGVKEFVQEYLECPPIIPRCMWGAKPYKGTPTNLTLPLPFLYIHHTSTPRDPCLTLQQCSEDMRAMQRFHQDDRGWDDIGYRCREGGVSG
ncbi:hypothetical protein CgunFtcFv8_008953 [Champsocephalus gunnari]|uniref:Peptidoglycan recognition protein family domain-containing protein n=1 Tax=Champsocephalus gunnari TaxID=52237 RepID=A0AAN8HJF7_CHAGU|nr:hypothetical protein CgunFtcFv8_008953 [Champsocephalus gunnari]